MARSCLARRSSQTAPRSRTCPVRGRVARADVGPMSSASSERIGLWIKIVSLDNAGRVKRRRRTPLDMTIFPRYMFLQPRSFEGASGVRPKAERGAASRAPCLASTALGRSGTRPGGTTTPTRYVRYRDDSHAQRQCWKRAVSGSATPVTENRRAERRAALRSLRQGDAHAARCATEYSKRHSALRPSSLRGERPAVQGTRTATVAPTEAAADFAWLFDNLAV